MRYTIGRRTFSGLLLLILAVLLPGIAFASGVAWPGPGTIAAGGYHTLGLRPDGTVAAAGWNNKDQLNVTGWANIVQVSAGWYHTIGLKSDGTVVAVGNNGEGQCNVSGWTGIVQVTAGRYHTTGLKSDGTVQAVGYNNYGQLNVAEWADIVQIGAGYHQTIGVKPGGMVVGAGDNSSSQLNVSSWTDIVQVGAGRYHTVGLKSDGTVVAAGANTVDQCNVSAWNLKPINYPPVLSPIGDQTVNEGQALVFTISATDPDNNELTFSAANLPTGATFDPATLVFSWTPGYGQEGSYPNVLFTVTDNGTPPMSASAAITITVGHTNRPPALNMIGNKTVNEGEVLSFTVNGSDPDGDAVTFSASNLPSGAIFDPSTATFNWSPNYTQAGSYTNVLFAATDTGTPALTASEAITISVGNVNRPPVLTPIGNRTVEENSLLTFTVTATDPDGDALTYSSANLPQGATFDPATRTFAWTPEYNQAGYCPGIVIYVTDGSAVVHEEFSITVGNVNRPPVFSPVGALTVNEGDLLRFQVNATDYDGDAVTYSTGPLPSGATFDPATRAFAWTPTYSQSGSYALAFRVTDNGVPPMMAEMTVPISVGQPLTTDLTKDIRQILAKYPVTLKSASYIASMNLHLRQIDMYYVRGGMTKFLIAVEAQLMVVQTNLAAQRGIISEADKKAIVAAATELQKVYQRR